MDLWNTVDRVTEAEDRIGELEDTVRDFKSAVSQLSSSNWVLLERVEDGKNRTWGAITFA